MNPEAPPLVIRMTSDNFPLFIALAGAVVAAVAFLMQRARKPSEAQSLVAKIAWTAYAVSAAAAVYATVYLLQAIFSGQRFDIQYVFANSAPDDALLYKISALWAGGQGSFLFWAMIGAIIGVPIARKYSADSPLAVAFWSAIQACLLLFLVVDDPFARIADYQPGAFGTGMSPILKNPWIAIHPPVVFLGYALLCVPAALAVQALIDKSTEKWVERSLPWALAGWVSLGAGILLGMFWSYEVLGWGGYWKWDPVENASFIPWLIGTALLHGLITQRNRGGFAGVNTLLSFAAFLSVFFATYLTRCGLPESVSVHSFGENAGAPFIKWSLISFAAISVMLSAVFIPKLRGGTRGGQPKRDLLPATRYVALVIGVIVLSGFAFMVLAGTTVPLFTSATVKEAFYNTQSVPLTMIVMALIALVPFVTWSRITDAIARARALQLLGCALGFVAAGLLADMGARLFGLMLLPIVLLILPAVAALASAVYACVKSGMKRSGAHLAHAGVAMFVIGVVFSSMAGSSDALKLPLGGEPAEAAGRKFTYLGRSALKGDREVIRLKIEQGGRSRMVRITRQFSDRGIVTNPYIDSTLAGDLYIAPKDVRYTSVSPAVSMQDGNWVSSPVRIPGSSATLTLDGMQVESHSARLIYRKGEGKPVSLVVSADQPAEIDGYVLSFIKFFQEGGQHASMVGVDLAIRGHGATERAVIEVNIKPLIWMVWLGGVLMLVGGTVAFVRRLAQT